jgi:outer membrane receptor protein involved in Fe transport
MRLQSACRRWTWFSVVCLLVALPVVASGQAETGRLAGTVRDPQGDPVPGAAVTIRSQSTGATREAVTGSDGIFAFPNLQPAVWEITIRLTGFKTYSTTATVSPGGSIAVAPVLEVGGVEELVTVIGRTAVDVNIQTQEVMTTVTAAQIANLPTITRDPYDLVAVAGNVSPGDPVNDGAVLNRGVGFSINGQRTSSVNILLDGSSNNNEFTAGKGQTIPLDAVQEFSVVTSSFSPEYGRASGGIVNVVVKSGSNALSGSAYEFYRSSDFASNNFDNKARGIEKGEFTRHQPGVSMGGPIRRDRAFFFGSYEHIRVRSIDKLITFVPTPELLAFTSPQTRAFFNAFPLAVPINGPIITRGDVAATRPGGPFEAIPAGTPVFGQVQQDVPIDAGGGTPQDTNLFVTRMDLNLGANTTAYFRYAMEDVTWLEGTNSQSPYRGFQSSFNALNQNILGSVTHVFSPTFTSQSKVVFNRLNELQGLGEAPAGPTLYPHPSAAQRLQGIRLGFPGYLPFSPGSAIPFGGPQNLLQLYEDVNVLRGRHEFRFGGQYVRIFDNRTFGAYMNAVEVLGNNLGEALDNLVTGNLVRFQAAINPQGRFPGDFITLPVGFPSFTRNNRYNEFALYANDSISLTDRFKLNLGLRYEYFGVQKNTDPQLDANFYYGTGSSIPERLRNGRAMRAPDSPVGGLWEPDYNNFAPRVGFAWDVSGDGRQSLRGGYGIGYERNFGNVTFNVMFNPPNYAVISITPADVGPIAITTDNAGPLAGSPGTQKVIPTSTLRHVDQNIETAYAHFWSLSYQRELGRSFVGSVDYTGSAGRKLYDLSDYNKIGGGLIFFGDASPFSRPNTQFSFFNTRGNRGKSNYHGVTVGVDGRAMGDLGLTSGVKYTLSWAKDNLSSVFSEGQNGWGQLGFLDAFDPDLDYGWAEFDARHRVSANLIWQLPVGRNATGFAGGFLQGWQVLGLFSANTGTPFTIYDCSNNLGVFCMRMLEVSPLDHSGPRNPPVVQGEPNRFRYIDLSGQASGVGSYVHPRLGTAEFGPYPANMTKRNDFRGPGRWYFDMAVSKDVRLAGTSRLQLRAEFYNILNHANLYVQGSEAFIDSLDYIPAARGLDQLGRDQRRIQFAVKYLW